MKWKCPNTSCVEHGVVKELGPGSAITTWTCKVCATPLVLAERK